MPSPDPIPSYPSGQSLEVWPGESYSGVTEGSSVLAQAEQACVRMPSLGPGLVSALSWEPDSPKDLPGHQRQTQNKQCIFFVKLP